MPNWKLVDQDTRIELAIGAERATFRNGLVKIDRLQPPDQFGSMGRVYVTFGDGSRSSGLFPDVVNAEFVDRDGERARVEKEALNAQPVDAAFAIISYNTFHRLFGPLPHPHPIDLEMILMDRLSASEIGDISRRVSALLQDAYQAGDDLLSKRSTYTQIANGLRQRHPGFSDKCYDDTVNQGCFLAR